MATAWADARKRGFTVTFGVRFDGIPYEFLEPLARAESVEGVALNSTASNTISHALAIFDGMRVSIELDRKTGIASGRALEVVLGWDAIEDESLDAALFTEPSDVALLTADHTSSETPINVDSTSSWASSGGLYLGLEYATYTGKTPTTFTTVTRGASGLRHAHLEKSPGYYRQATDVPRYWRGRLVTLYEHLTAPDGRLLSEDVNDVGTYCREVWRGYVDEQPRPTARGMTLRCLPLVRLGERELGREVTGHVWTPADMNTPGDDFFDMPLYVTANDRLSFEVLYGGNLEREQVTPLVGSGGTVLAVRAYAKALAGVFNAASWSPGWSSVTPLSVGWFLQRAIVNGGAMLRMRIDKGTATNLSVTTQGHWFIPDDRYTAVQSGNVLDLSIPFRPGWSGTGWLPVILDESDDWNSYTVPTAGYVTIKMGEVTEIMRFDAVEDSNRARGKLLHIAQRWVNDTGSDQLNPWIDGGEISFVAGHTGPLHEVARTLLTSSGESTLRGDYDTLGAAYGFGLPDSLVDTTSFESYPLDGQDAMAVVDGTGTLEDLVGGWLVLYQRCLVQRRDSGSVKIAVVDTWPADADDSATLDTSNVLIDTTGTPETLTAPNRLRITLSVMDNGAPIVAHDIPRIQAEGVEELDVSVPGADGGIALELGQELMAQSYGMSAVTLTVPCWIDAQPGDAVSIEAAHPLMWDWATGARGPAQVDGRVLGWELDLVSGDQRLTVLYGNPGRYLCPAVVIASRTDSKHFEVASSDEAGRFVAGETVLIYTPGKESTEEVADVVVAVSGTEIELTTAMAAWVDTGAIITHAAYGSASVRQRAYAYVEANTRFL